jgi:outer membrane immunogenic protein
MYQPPFLSPGRRRLPLTLAMRRLQPICRRRSSPGPAFMSAASLVTPGAPAPSTSLGFDPAPLTVISGPLGSNPGGVVGGAHAGYQYQFKQLVLGIEGSIDWTSLTSTGVAAFPVVFGGSTLSAHTSAGVQGSIRGKIGLALDRVLIYGTGGVAFGGFSTTFALAAPNLAPPIFSTANASTTRAGWTAGGGLQYSVTNNWWIFAEYRFTQFRTLQSDFLVTELPAGASLNGDRRLQDNQVQAGFSYRFDAYAPVPVVSKY